jgi:hypothetical protein
MRRTLVRPLALAAFLTALITLSLLRGANGAAPCTTKPDPTTLCKNAVATFECSHWQPSGATICNSKLSYDCYTWQPFDVTKGYTCKEDLTSNSECVLATASLGEADVDTCCEAYQCQWNTSDNTCVFVRSAANDIPSFYYKTVPCVKNGDPVTLP